MWQIFIGRVTCALVYRDAREIMLMKHVFLQSLELLND